MTFWLKNDPGVNTSGVPSEFDVEWDQIIVFHLLETDTDTNYHMYTVNLPFEKTEGGILQFDAIQNPSEWHLDDVIAVQGTAVPEPSALLLGLSGALGVSVLGLSLAIQSAGCIPASRSRQAKCSLFPQALRRPSR